MNQAARKAGFLPSSANTYPLTSHVGFGVVLGADGKRFRSGDTDIVPLVDLLDEAKNRSRAALIKRGTCHKPLRCYVFLDACPRIHPLVVPLCFLAEEKEIKWTLEELDQTSEAVGYAAVK